MCVGDGLDVSSDNQPDQSVPVCVGYVDCFHVPAIAQD